jgi:hypothetical protein
VNAAATATSHQVLSDPGSRRLAVDPLSTSAVLSEGGDPLSTPAVLSEGGDPLSTPAVLSEGGDPLSTPASGGVVALSTRSLGACT